MPNKIERLSGTTSGLSLTTSPTTTACIPYGAVAGGMLYVESVTSATKITWYASPSVEGQRFSVTDGYNPQTTFVSALTAQPIPDACYAAPYLFPVVDAGSATVSISVKG